MVKWFTVQNSIGSVWAIRVETEEEAKQKAEYMIQFEEELERNGNENVNS